MSRFIFIVWLLGVFVAGTFIGLKLTGHLTWGWLLVLSPLLADSVLILALLLLAASIEGTTRSVSDVWSFLGRGRRMQRIVDLGTAPPEHTSAADSATWWEPRNRS